MCSRSFAEKIKNDSARFENGNRRRREITGRSELWRTQESVQEHQSKSQNEAIGQTAQAPSENFVEKEERLEELPEGEIQSAGFTRQDQTQKARVHETDSGKNREHEAKSDSTRRFEHTGNAEEPTSC